MGSAIDVIGYALLLSFILSCIFSGVMQVIAWSRHAKPGVVPSLRALWRPDGYLDEIGVRQIRIARSLLIVGVVAYLSYGLLVAVRAALAG